MKKKIVIVAGGMLEETFVLAMLHDPAVDCIVAVDRGLNFLYAHGIVPDVVVGDFDSVCTKVISYYKGFSQIVFHPCDPIKDASDTEIAINLCIRSMTADEILEKQICILGATGKRLDHFWANVQVLKIALDEGVDCRILDAHNQIRLLAGTTVLRKEETFGKYFSVFPLGKEVEQFYISGAKYPLVNHCLSAYSSRCTSNEFLEPIVEISFPAGVVILMETKD
ncbi:MAG: thiamine diphosphokinase [Lachnospiraceae bacterium]|nr:thiamine diphosphokinase [Lachnospiraceae bacterium]